MAQRIQLRKGDASVWTTANPILADGEPGVESDTGKFKVGNGVSLWTELPYGFYTPVAANGMPTGGTINQVLAKIDSADFNVQWITPSVGSSFPAAITRVTRTTSQSVSVWVPISWDTEVFDTANAFVITAPTKITVPTGKTKIQLKGYVIWSNVTSLGRYVSLRKNGTDTFQVVIQTSKNESGQTIDAGWMNCVAGDYFELLVTNSSDGSTVMGPSTGFGGSSWFEATFD